MSSTALSPRSFAGRPGPRTLLDAAVAAVVLIGSLVLLSHGGAVGARASHALDPLGVVLAACSALPLIAWRRFPLAVFAVTATACVLLAGLDYPVGLTLGPTVAVYLLAASRDRPAASTTAIVVGLFTAYVAALALTRGAFPGIATLHTGLAWAAAWFAGERTRLRQAQVAELKDRARRTERDAERERLLAVAEERTRIARDLHDSAAHAISLIAVRAGAARLRHHQDPDRSVAALQAVEDLARQTVADIDQIVGTLRETPAGDRDTAPPGLASMDTLVAHHAAAGLRVTVGTRGPARPLGAAADQAAYRILQEALTNAANHGSGSARVALTYTDEAVELAVTNPTGTVGAPRPGGGHGLIGMRERATLLGGHLDVDRADGTFRVRARIPYAGPQR